jgi:hypothetical protein
MILHSKALAVCVVVAVVYVCMLCCAVFAQLVHSGMLLY